LVKQKSLSYSLAVARILILLSLGASFLLSLPVIAERARWEKQNDRVLTIVDFDEFLAMCGSESLPVTACAEEFSRRRVAVAMSELSVSERVSRGEVQVSRENDDLVVTAPESLETELSISLVSERRSENPSRSWNLSIAPPLDRQGAGFAVPSDERRKIRASWVLRPVARPFWTPEQIQAFSRRLSDEPSVSLLLSSGEEVLGFPGAYREAADGYAMVALPEFSQQRGAEALAAAHSGKALRLHTIPPEEWSRYTMESARMRLVRAVRERSVRLLYIHPAPTRSLAENLQFVDALMTDLSQAGFEPGPPSLQSPPHNPYAPVLIGAASAILALELSALLLAMGATLLVCVVAALILTGTALSVSPSVFGAVTFSLLIGLALGSVRGAPFLRWLFICLLSVVSGTIVAAMIQTPALLKGIEAPGGIRLSLVIPSLMAFLFAYHRDPAGWVRALKTRSVSLLDATVGVCVIAAGGYVLMRAGSAEGWQLPLEARIRTILERYLPIRPRFKEVFGHPLLIAGPKVGREGVLMTAFLASLGALAPASIFNSFFHLHTPMATILLRIATGIVIGAAIGALLLVVLKRYENPLRRLFR
jgi:hypothetical protein